MYHLLIRFNYGTKNFCTNSLKNYVKKINEKMVFNEILRITAAIKEEQK